jgi:hypothetical protein
LRYSLLTAWACFDVKRIDFGNLLRVMLKKNSTQMWLETVEAVEAAEVRVID